MKKILCVLLVMVIVIPALLAAGRQATPSGGVQTITYLNISSSGITPEPNNPVLQAIEQRIGVRVDATLTSSVDYDAKLNTLIASRQLPDLFFARSLSDAISFTQEGMLANLTNPVAQYGKNLEREMGSVYRASPVNKNGLYFICGNGAVYYQNLCVRVDWLKKVGLPMPTDLDSLYNVLYAFTYNDPDGNGRNDTVGIVLSAIVPNHWTVLFGAFGIAYDRPYLLSNGTVTTYMKAPGYLDAINYLRKLYQNRVMDTEFATMPGMTAHEALWTGRCGVYGFQAVGTTNNWYPSRYTFPVPADPAEIFGYTDIKGPNGYHGAPKEYRNVSSGFVVASSAKSPDACVKFLDFMATAEGDQLLNLGVEGVMFAWDDKAAGKYHRIGDYVDDSYHRVKGGFTYWAGFPVEHTELLTMNKLTRDAQAFVRANSFDWPFIYTPFNEAAEYGSALSTITSEALARLIVTTGNVEAEYRTFVTRWENEGGLQWERGATAAYNSQR